MQITGGTFHEEVEDVLANDQHALVLSRHRFTRDGSSRDYKTAHVYEIRDRKLAKCFDNLGICQLRFVFWDPISHSRRTRLGQDQV